MSTKAEKIWDDATSGDKVSLINNLRGVTPADFLFQKAGSTGQECTALGSAAFHGHTEILGLLLRAGADPNGQDKLGRTALHYADSAMKFTCVLALLGADANPFAKDKEGKPAMDQEGVMMQMVVDLIESKKRAEEPPKECYQVFCPVRAELNGVYEITQEDTFKQLGGSFVLSRNPQDNLWVINNGDFFLVTSFDFAADPSLVQCWKVKGAKKFARCPEMRVYKPTIHKNVTCDECKANPIIGVRYKCVGRGDYDYCGACEAKQTPPFPTLKLYTHEQRPAKFSFTCAGARSITSIPTNAATAADLSTASHPGVTCSACQMSPIVGPRFTCAGPPGFDLCASCEAATATQQGVQLQAMVKIYDPRHAPSAVDYAPTEPAKTPAAVPTTSTTSTTASPPPSGSAGAAASTAATASTTTTTSANAKEPAATAAPKPPAPAAAVPAPTSAAPPLPASQPKAQAPSVPLPPMPQPTAGPAKPAFRISCAELPEVDGVYEQEFEDQYTMRGGGSNTLTRHPVDNVWCVSNGHLFILVAVDAAAADPVAVKAWKIRVKNKLVESRSVVVAQN